MGGYNVNGIIISNTSTLVNACYIECPYCHSKKTTGRTLSSLLNVAGPICMVTLIGIPIGIILLVISAISAVANRNVTVNCKECGKRFIIPKREFMQHIKNLKQAKKIHLPSNQL